MSSVTVEMSGQSAEAPTDRIQEFQLECIELFAHAARALALPKSVGQIYGLLFSSQTDLSLDEVALKLKISRGSASQGLRWLRDIGAARLSFVPGDRRDRFTAETELRRLATGFLRETAEPHLRNGEDHLARLQESWKEMAPSEEREFSKNRISKLRRWHKFANQTLPLILKVAGKF